ncbi:MULTISPECIES: tyrosine-type recombinase/integrase [unclassified Marinovum]|uniref:tyrosine-type recombinase/integrase n=1 Tax=unclassified Marinovum TaxID=2647166 RepID=UPI003EDBDA6E
MLSPTSRVVRPLARSLKASLIFLIGNLAIGSLPLSKERKATRHVIAQHPGKGLRDLVREPRNLVRAKSEWLSASDWNPCPRHPGARMGLRSEEILQLRLDDIEITNDIPCIVLKQGPGQSLKSKAARRTVPIHDNLLRLGFMQLVALRRREGEDRLFPWLERSQSKKTLTENFSKRFTKYRKDHKIYDPQRDFHSFRTTFNDLAILAERQDSHRRAIMGHVEHDVGITNYNPSGFSMKTLRDCVNAVDIDVSMIRSPFAEAASASVTELSAHRTKSSA